MNIIFVKFGDKYSAEDVNRLFFYLHPFLYGKYWCYTDDPTGIDECINVIEPLEKPLLRKWWNKLALFSPDMPFEGECVFFDLDIKINYSMENYLKFDDLYLVNSYWKEDLFFRKHAFDTRVNSSIITWKPEYVHSIWQKFVKNYDYYTRKYAGIDRFIWNEDVQYKLLSDGIMNSVNNPYGRECPVDSWNNIKYETHNT